MRFDVASHRRRRFASKQANAQYFVFISITQHLKLNKSLNRFTLAFLVCALMFIVYVHNVCVSWSGDDRKRHRANGWAKKNFYMRTIRINSEFFPASTLLIVSLRIACRKTIFFRLVYSGEKFLIRFIPTVGLWLIQMNLVETYVTWKLLQTTILCIFLVK